MQSFAQLESTSTYNVLFSTNNFKIFISMHVKQICIFVVGTTTINNTSTCKVGT